MALLVGRVDEERLGAGQRLECPVEHRGAGALGQHEPAARAGERFRDALGREMRLDGQVRAAGLEDREHGGHPVQITLGHDADDAFAEQPPRAQGSRELIRVAVELAVGPLPAGVLGGHGVGVGFGSLLEELVGTPRRQRALRSGEIMKLEPQLLGGEQRHLRVLRGRIGRDRRECVCVISRDPRGVVRVERVRPVAQPQRKPMGCHEADAENRVFAELVVARGGLEHGLEQRLGEAELAGEIGDREIGVRQELRLGLGRCHEQLPPRARRRRQRARQRGAARRGVARAHVALSRERAEHLRVRAEEHRGERHRELVREPAQRRREIVGQLRRVLGDATLRARGPPRQRGESAGEQRSAPELPVALRGRRRVPGGHANVSHLIVPSPGSLPISRRAERARPSSGTSPRRARSRHPS